MNKTTWGLLYCKERKAFWGRFSLKYIVICQLSCFVDVFISSSRHQRYTIRNIITTSRRHYTLLSCHSSIVPDKHNKKTETRIMFYWFRKWLLGKEKFIIGRRKLNEEIRTKNKINCERYIYCKQIKLSLNSLFDHSRKFPLSPKIINCCSILYFRLFS